MQYQKDCSKCHGKGFEEFEAGLVQVACEECDATGKILVDIPEQKEGQYFCLRCEKAHKETSQLGISHLEYKAQGEIKEPSHLMIPEAIPGKTVEETADIAREILKQARVV